MNKDISYTEVAMNQNSNLVLRQVSQIKDCEWQLDSESKLTIIVPTNKITAGLYFLFPVESNSSSDEKNFVLIQTNEVNVDQNVTVNIQNGEVVKNVNSIDCEVKTEELISTDSNTKKQSINDANQLEINPQFQDYAQQIMETHSQPQVAKEQLKSINDKLISETPTQENIQINADVNVGFRWAKRCRVLDLLKNNKQIARSERKSYAEIAEIAGCGVRLVKKIAKMLRNNCNIEHDDLIENKRGRKESPFETVPYFVYLCLISAVHFALPSDYGIETSTWSANAVRMFLAICDIVVSQRYVYYILDRFGFKSKVGRRINPKKNQDAVNTFTGDTYVELCKEAKERGETILFCDETSVQQGEKMYGYSLVGERSNTSYTQNNRHTAMSLITFIGPDGTIEVFEIEGSFDAEKFCDCLKQLKKKYPDKKFLIILDNARVHHAKKVNSWLNHWKAGKNVMRFKFLPAYAPEINPVERFNNVAKNALKKDECLSSKSVTIKAHEFVADFLKEAEQNANKVINLFYDEDCRYSIDIYEKVAKGA